MTTPDGRNVTEPYFRSTQSGLLPDPSARAPWAEDMLHGRLIGGLAARGLGAEFGDEGWRAARLTVDLFRPAGMGELTISTEPVRLGRRIRVGDAHVASGGHLVARVTAVFLAESTEPPGKIWRPDPVPWPDPDVLDDRAYDDGTIPAWLIRGVEGGFGVGGRSRVWSNDTAPLVDEEELTPFVRAALSGDLACPLANSSDQGLHYINSDYTMALARYPEGPWIGLQVAQQIAADGISVGSCLMVDRDGPFATSTGSSLATAPLADPE